jgi:hypothetical protein
VGEQICPCPCHGGMQGEQILQLYLFIILVLNGEEWSLHAPTAIPIANEGGWSPEPVKCVWNVMAHAQNIDFIFWRNGQAHLNWRGHQFSRLLAAEVCASAVVMGIKLDTPCSEVVWRVLATHSIRQFPLHFPTCASPCVITFWLDSTILEKRKISCPCRGLNSGPYSL